jgi:hypothetical protein
MTFAGKKKLKDLERCFFKKVFCLMLFENLVQKIDCKFHETLRMKLKGLFEFTCYCESVSNGLLVLFTTIMEIY